MAKFKLEEYVGFPVLAGYEILQVIDITSQYYKLKDALDPQWVMDYYQNYVDRNFVSLGMHKEAVEVLYG